MGERVPHDHPTIETLEATLRRRGRTTGPVVRVEAHPLEEVATPVRLLMDGSQYWTIFEVRDRGIEIRYVSETESALADQPPELNALVDWVEDAGLTFGRSLHLDVVEPGFKYGLRAPGESAIYGSGRPDSSLSEIAQNLE